MDKFFYTGSIETVAIHGVQDITGRLGRLGIGLKTEVEAWGYKYKGLKKLSRRRGKYVEEPLKEYCSKTSVARLRDEGLLERGKLVRTKLNPWVRRSLGNCCRYQGPLNLSSFPITQVVISLAQLECDVTASR